MELFLIENYISYIVNEKDILLRILSDVFEIDQKALKYLIKLKVKKNSHWKYYFDVLG